MQLLQTDSRVSWLLCFLSLVSYALTFCLNVVLARHLSVSDFDDYNVAMAIVVMTATFATLGLEKYALYELPVLNHRGNRSAVRSYLRYSRTVIVGFSICLAIAFGSTIEGVLTYLGGNFHLAIPVAIAFLPIIAWGLFLVEAVTAAGHRIAATALYRIALPLTWLILNAGFVWSGRQHTALNATILFGAGWAATVVSLSILLRRTEMVQRIRDVRAKKSTRRWLRGAVPLMLYSVILTAQGQLGVIVLELLYPSDPVVSQYAIALSVGSFVLLIATATNRFYLPIYATLLEHGNMAELRRVRRSRLRWVALLALGFALFVRVFGHSILLLFGSQFVQANTALQWMVTGTTIAVLFSPTPYLMQFMGYRRTVLLISFFSLAATLLLSWILGERYGASGVAVAYAGPLVIQFLTLEWVVRRVLRLPSLPHSPKKAYPEGLV